MKTGSQVFVKDIQPGGIANIEQEGDYFFLIECPISVDVRVTGGSFMPYVQDTGEDYSRVGSFKRVDIRNPSLSQIRVVIYVGWSRYLSSRSSVIEPPTQCRGWSGSSIAANTGETFDGIPSGDQLRRKALIVSNEDANLKLHVRDADGEVIAVVFPESELMFPISGPVEIYNPNGAAIAARVGEIFWMSQAVVS